MIDRRLAALVAEQCGIVTRRQARAAGLTDDAIRARLDSGRWRKVHRSVFVTHTGPLTAQAGIWAAVLAAGPGATASHETAAFLHTLLDEPPDAPHVTLPVHRRVTVSGVHVHYAHRLGESRHPTLTPPRTRVEDTVLDLVDRADDVREVATWVTRACQRRLTTPSRLWLALDRRKKICWRSATTAMVADVDEGADSPLEIEYLRGVERAHGLPTGQRQHRRRAGRRVIWVDVDYEDHATRVELDGRVGHVAEGRFRDRRRDNRAARDGVTSLRYGHVEVFGDRCGVADEVAEVLRLHGWTDRPRRCGPACTLRLP